MLVALIMSAAAWHPPTLSYCAPQRDTSRSSIVNTLTPPRSTVLAFQTQASPVASPPSSRVENTQPTVPPIIHAASHFTMLMQIWPPLATAVAAALVLRRRTTLLTMLLSLEATHYCYACLVSRARGRSHTRPARGGHDQIALWRKCLFEDTTESTSTFITGWFLQSEQQGAVVRLEELRRENVAEFTSYALHSAHVDELDSVGQDELETCVRMIEERIATEEGQPGFRFPSGYNARLCAMTLNLDPPSLTMQARPLLYYFLSDVVSAVTATIMRARGFRRHREGKLSYWFHPGDTVGDVAAGVSPIVFVHGVGLGLAPYLGWLKHLRNLHAFGRRRSPMLVLELPFVSQRLGGLRSLPQEQRTTDEISRAMARHQLKSATFIGHSLGTVYLSWLAKLRPELLASCVFIDPIVFLLHQRKVWPSPTRLCLPHAPLSHMHTTSPRMDTVAHRAVRAPMRAPVRARCVQVAHAFIYDKPARDDPQAQVETFFVKSERSTATYFHRHFYWFSNILWADELAAPTAVVLAAEDTIVPVENIATYLEAHGDAPARSSSSHERTSIDRGNSSAIRSVVTLEGVRHGQFLIDEEARERVLSAVVDAQTWARRRDDKTRRPGRAVSTRGLRRQSKSSLPSWTSLLVVASKRESPTPFPQMTLGESFVL